MFGFIIKNCKKLKSWGNLYRYQKSLLIFDRENSNKSSICNKQSSLLKAYLIKIRAEINLNILILSFKLKTQYHIEIWRYYISMISITLTNGMIQVQEQRDLLVFWIKIGKINLLFCLAVMLSPPLICRLYIKENRCLRYWSSSTYTWLELAITTLTLAWKNFKVWSVEQKSPG